MTATGPLGRRDFLKLSAGAGLWLAVSGPGRVFAADPSAPPAGLSPSAWLHIGQDGVVTVHLGKSEMGQGSFTGMAVLIAEELEADWAKVRVLPADADPRFGNMVTGGSRSVRGNFIPLRKVGAAAREMLVAAGARRLGVRPGACSAEAGAVVHGASRRRVEYGALVADAAKLPVPEDPPLKDPRKFKLIGRRVPRLDTPPKVRGSAVFGLDVRVPGMLHAAVARPPTYGGKAKWFDAAAAGRVPGVRKVVEVPSGVAVLADSTWGAFRGRDLLAATFEPGPNGALDAAGIARTLAEAPVASESMRREGDVEKALAAAARRVEAVYTLPLLAHATMEPMNCVADVRADRAELWAPTQAPTWARSEVARALGIDESKVTVHVTFLGGGFGRRAFPDFAVEAAQVSLAAGVPVQVAWSREDDLRHDFYRPPGRNELRAGLNAKGRLVAWHHRVRTPSISRQLGRTPGGGAAPDVGEGASSVPYVIPAIRVDQAAPELGLPIGWWRSVYSSQNAFAEEVFIDELARAAGKDPLAFRLAHLPRAHRLRGVLKLAAGKAGWGGGVPKGHGLGIACHASFGSYVAHVAEVSVQSGRVTVHRVVCAVDCGTVLNPDSVAHQAEGSVVYGLSAALRGEITVKDGAVVQGNFDGYEPLRMREMPKVEVHVVPSRAEPGGMGEPALPPIALKGTLQGLLSHKGDWPPLHQSPGRWVVMKWPRSRRASLAALCSVALLASACGDRWSPPLEPLPPAPPAVPAISTSVASLRYSVFQGGGAAVAQAVEITNGGAGTLAWTASVEGYPWLAVGQVSGTAPSSLSVSVDAAGLAPGTHTGTITLSAADASNSPLHLPVTLLIVPEVSFAALVAAPVGSGPHATATADFDGDGRPDLAVTNEGSGTVSILLGAATGALGAAIEVGVGIGPKALAVGHFDGNATPDLAIANAGGNSVTILLGSGDGAFGAPKTQAVGSRPVSVAVADFDGDGDEDLAVANMGDGTGPNTVTVLKGTGTGSFDAGSSYAAGHAPSAVVAGDFNGDTIIDLAVADYDFNFQSTANLAILGGDGTGAFGPPSYVNTVSRPIAMVGEDLDGNGRVDLVIGTESGSGVTVLMGATGGGLSAPVNHPAPGSGVRSIGVRDLDGDGLRDLALTHNCTCDSDVSILMGIGGGAFGAATAVPAGGSAVSVEDFDQDGAPDLAAAGWGGFATLAYGRGDGTFLAPANMGAAKHSPQSVATGDFDGNGTLDVALVDRSSSWSSSANDFSLWLGDGTGAFGVPATYAIASPRSVALGDFDGDGNLDAVTANAGTVSVLPGSPDGALGPATNFVIGGSANFVAVSDLDGDGDLDLVVSAWPGAIYVLRGDGAGAFGAATAYAGGYEPHSVAIGDLDGDGIPDLVVADRGRGVSVLRGTGAAAFAEPSDFYASVLRYVELADFDDDGKLDLVSANHERAEIRMGRGDGTFAAASVFDVSGASGVTGDFNGDGTLDVALAEVGGSRVSFLLGGGDGTFFLGPTRYAAAQPIAYTYGIESADIAKGDFNRDGKIDLVCSNGEDWGSAYMSVLLGR